MFYSSMLSTLFSVNAAKSLSERWNEKKHEFPLIFFLIEAKVESHMVPTLSFGTVELFSVTRILAES